MAIYSASKIVVEGAFNSERKVEYEVQVSPAAGSETFGIKINNWDFLYQFEFTGQSDEVILRRSDGDGTFSDETVGVPIWVGDFLYSDNGQANAITSNANGFIGRVVSIEDGTEGHSVLEFKIDDGSGTDGISNSAINGTDKVDSRTQYKCQVHTGGACTSFDDKESKFGSGVAYMHGLTFYFNGSMTSPYMSDPDSFIGFYFTGYPVRTFQADKISKISKDGKHHIVGWSSSQAKFTMLEDAYSVSSSISGVPSTQNFIDFGIDIDSEPTFASRGDDNFVGIGTSDSPVYMGYPNITQFGQNMGDSFIVEKGEISVDTSVIPSLQEFCLPTGSTDDPAEDANIDLTGAAQIIVGYIKGSSYLMKATRGGGVESNMNMGGEICGIYLDHENNNEVWVLYDGVSDYMLKKVEIKASGTDMAIKDNKIYKLQDDNQNFINPFMEDVRLTDLIVLEGNCYLLASSANYYDQSASWADKCFGINLNKKAYLWRVDVSGVISAVPEIGYTIINPTDITVGFSTSPLDDNPEIDPYWIVYDIVDTWDIDPNGQGTGSSHMTNVGLNGGGGIDWVVEKAPHPKGLLLWSNDENYESIAVTFPYVYNTMNETYNSKVYDYFEAEGNTSQEGSATTRYKVGPLLRQKASGVVGVSVLGSHIEVYKDSEEHLDEGESSYEGIKKILINGGSSGIAHQETLQIGNVQGAAATIIIPLHNIDGSNYTDITGITSVMPNDSLKHPRGVVVSTNENIIFYDLVNDLTESTLNQDDLDGHVCLNASVDRKLFSPNSDISGWRLASQTYNYITTSSAKFSWIAVTTSDAFRCYYLDDVGNNSVTESSAWSHLDVMSSVKITISDGSTETDVNNLLPDGTDKTNNTHFYKIFYRVSLLYDGYQESCLGESTFSNTSGSNPNKFGHEIKISVLIDKLPKRLSHINIYRGRAFDGSATEPALDYQLVESVPLNGANWKTGSDNYVDYTIKDQQGKQYGSYEALTGLSPEMTTNWLSYSISEQCAGYLFIADANNREVTNVGNYVFRSKPGKYSIFNWANEYVALQDKPTAMKAYNNLLYVFSESNCYTVNPNNLAIVDKMEGAGCLHSKSVIATDYGMFFADKYGVYQHNGKAAKVISTPIYSSDNTDLTNFTWDAISTSLETSPPKLAFDGERKALLVIFDVSSSSYAWVYSVMNRRWDFWSFTNSIKSVTQGKYGEILASDGKLLQIGTNPTRKAWEFQSKKITAGFDTYEKSFSEIHTEGSAGLVTKYKNPSNGAFQSLTSNRVSSSHKKAKWMQVQVVDSNGTRTMESIGLHLRPIKARSSKV